MSPWCNHGCITKEITGKHILKKASTISRQLSISLKLTKSKFNHVSHLRFKLLKIYKRKSTFSLN